MITWFLWDGIILQSRLISYCSCCVKLGKLISLGIFIIGVKKISFVRCQTKVHNCKYSYLLRYFIVLLSKILLLIEFCFIISLIFLIFSPCPKYTSLGVRLSNDSWNDFRHARKLQTIREMIFAERENAKPFGK